MKVEMDKKYTRKKKKTIINNKKKLNQNSFSNMSKLIGFGILVVLIIIIILVVVFVPRKNNDDAQQSLKKKAATTPDLPSAVLQGPAVVVFSTQSCIFCKAIDPAIKDADTNTPSVTFYYVKPEELLPIGQKYGVTGYPTLLRFKNGKHEAFKGTRTKEAIQAFAESGSP